MLGLSVQGRAAGWPHRAPEVEEESRFEDIYSNYCFLREAARGTPEPLANQVPCPPHLRLASVQVRSTRKRSPRNAGGPASRWVGVGECASAISSLVRDFTGPQAARWNSPTALCLEAVPAAVTRHCGELRRTQPFKNYAVGYNRHDL